jgi:plastocyanin
MLLMSAFRPIGVPGVRLLASAFATLALALAACSGAGQSASPSTGAQSSADISSASAAASLNASAAASLSTSPSVSAGPTAGSSLSPSAACGVTPGATATATVTIKSSGFVGSPTIQTGQAVAFTNQDSAAHTVTNGTLGLAAAGACVNEFVDAGTSLVVTFQKAGDYEITCRLHPTESTTIHVQ